MKKILIIAILTILYTLSYKTYSSPSSEVISILNTTVNYAPPGYYKTAERGYIGLGSLSMRTDPGSLNFQSPISITAPTIRSGCGAIDIAMGGFAFLNFEYLVQKLQGIMQAAPAFAFQLAIETFAPQIGNILSKLEAVADAINNINFNACNAARNLAVSIRKNFLEPQDSNRAGNDTAKGSSNFWDSFANTLGIQDQLKALKDAWTNLASTFTSSNMNAKSLFNNNSFILKSITGACSSSKVGFAYNEPKARPGNYYLRYYDSNDYILKAAIYGDIHVSAHNISGFSIKSECDNPVAPIDASKIIEDFRTKLNEAKNSEDLCNSLSNVQINVFNSTLSFNLKNFCDNLKSALEGYAANIKNGTALDNDKIKYINLVAATSPDVIRLIKVSALLGEDSITINNYLKELLPYIITKAFIEYMRGIVNEGYLEYVAVLDYYKTALNEIRIKNTENSSEGKPTIGDSVEIIERIIDSYKELSKLSHNSNLAVITQISSNLDDVFESRLSGVRQIVDKKESLLKKELKKNNWLFLYTKINGLY